MPKEKDMHAIELIGSPEKLINALVKSKENREWALKKITVEGPPHKQLQHTLVLNRLEKLVDLYKKSNGMMLKPIIGESAPREEVMKEYGFSVENVIAKAKALLQ